jgi:plastocyanin
MSMRKSMGFIVVAAGVAVLLPVGEAAARTTVAIKGIEFRSPSVTVSTGEVVVWNDKDRYTSHTVTSRGNSKFSSSGYLQAGDKHRVRFTQAGSYRYVCKVHPNMRGRIVVR